MGNEEKFKNVWETPLSDPIQEITNTINSPEFKKYEASVRKLTDAYSLFLKETYKCVERMRKYGTKKEKLRYLFPKKPIKVIPKLIIKKEPGGISAVYECDFSKLVKQYTQKQIYHGFKRNHK